MQRTPAIIAALATSGALIATGDGPRRTIVGDQRRTCLPALQLDRRPAGRRGPRTAARRRLAGQHHAGAAQEQPEHHLDRR